MRTQGARASRCISLYITSCCSYPSTTHLPFHHLGFPFHACLSSSFFVRLRPRSGLCATNTLAYVFLLKGYTCCCILLCRIAEFSCLLNLLTTLNYFIPALFPHIFTHPHCTSTHSHRSRSLPSSWVSVSFHTTHARMHSTSRMTRVIHCSTVSAYPGAFTLPTDQRQLYPFPSTRFLFPFTVTPFYRHGSWVTS